VQQELQVNLSALAYFLWCAQLLWHGGINSPKKRTR